LPLQTHSGRVFMGLATATKDLQWKHPGRHEWKSDVVHLSVVMSDLLVERF